MVAGHQEQTSQVNDFSAFLAMDNGSIQAQWNVSWDMRLLSRGPFIQSTSAYLVLHSEFLSWCTVCVCVCVCVCDRQGLGLHPHRTGWWGTLWLFAHKSKLKVLLWLESATWSASITAPTSCYLGILMLSRLVSLIFSSIYRLILASVSLHCCFLCLNALSPNLYGWLP